MNDLKLFKKSKTIFWRKEAETIKVSQEEFKNIYNECLKKGKEAKSKINLLDWVGNYTYLLINSSKYWNLRVHINGKYFIYTTNSIDSTKNMKSGTDAIQLFSAKFAEKNNMSKNRPLYYAYGTTEIEFLNCVPKQFYYINRRYLNKELHNVSSIDATSHYPSCACGTLPDSKTAVKYKGTVKPNAEYPFAFYIKSGHCAEYNVFDTHNWMTSPYINELIKRETLINRMMNPNDDITVLMKASKYTMDSTWAYFYEMRKQDPDCKLVMNATIGNFHRTNYTQYKYAHLAAIIIGRANNKQLEMMNKIGTINIIHTCVDGIIYFGNKKIGIDEKKMNTYQQEFLGCEFKMISTNCYMAMKDNKLIKYKHGSFNMIKDTNLYIADNPPKSFDDMNNWIRYDVLKELRDENQK